MNLREVFDGTSRRMVASIHRASAASSHSRVKGDQAEEEVRGFLRDYLPASLSISKGHLVGAHGGTSRHLDVIVYDSVSTPVLFIGDEDDRVIPVECAYAVIEVKKRLRSSDLPEIRDNMASARKLNKQDAYRVRALHRFEDVYGKSWPWWPINYLVITFDSSSSIGGICARLDDLEEKEQAPPWRRIDTVCVIDEGVICNRTKDDTYQLLPEMESVRETIETTDALLLLYALWSQVWTRYRTDGVNLLRYLDAAELALPRLTERDWWR